jgi:hypothetical protein
MKRQIQALRWPLIIEIVNSIILQVSGRSSIILFLSWCITITIIFWSGWLIIKKKWGTLLRAACSGPMILILGFTLIGGAYNVITGDFSHVGKALKIDINPRLAYLGGVVLSTLAVLPLAALISWLGGVIGRRKYGMVEKEKRGSNLYS